MIVIKHPYIESGKDSVFLKCDILDSGNPKRNAYTLWYSVRSEYGKFFCDEVADPFLLVMLQLAIASHQDIKVEAPVSGKLLFHLRHAVIPMLKRVIPRGGDISIDAEGTDISFENADAVGTGCSLGIDSFSTICRYIKEDIPNYKLTHLAIFNSGQFGDLDLASAEKAFYDNVEQLKPFAEEIGLPIVAVNSNLNDPYADYSFPLLQRFVQTTLSAVLSLQKLFSKYIFASSHPAYEFKFTPEDISYCESAVVPLFGTQNTEMILSAPMMTRVEKTEYISHDLLVRKYLNVCWSTQITNMTTGSTLLAGKTKLNCGKCDKCLRTLLTLELLGCLEDYAEIFDLNEYRKYRNKYIIKVLSYHRTDTFLSEIYDLMKTRNFKIPLTLYAASYGVRLGLYRFVQKVFGLTTMAK